MALPLTASLPQSGSIVSRWKLNETSGNRADSVGSNTLVDQNAVGYVSGQFSENAADFERDSSQYLSISDANQSGLDITGDLSWSAWVKFETLTAYHMLFGKSLHTGNQRSYLLYEYKSGGNQVLSFQTNPDGSTNYTSTVTWSPSTGVWYHLALVYDASAHEVKFFVDGVQQGATQTNAATSNYNGTSEFAIGSYHTLDYADMQMQDAVIWAYELSDAEVASLYEAYFPVVDVTVTPSVLTISSSVQEVTVVGFVPVDVTVTPSVLTISSSVQEVTVVGFVPSVARFSVGVFDRLGQNSLEKFTKFVSLWYDDTIEGARQAEFVIPINRPELTEANLKVYNRVKIYQGDVLKWRGYIASWNIQDQNVRVMCNGMMEYMNKRTVTESISEAVDTATEGIIDDMNAADPTDLTFGAVGASTSYAFDFTRQKIGDALRQIAKAIGGDPWVNLQNQVRIDVPRGSDKSSTVIFKFLDIRPNETNMTGVDVVVSGDTMVNRLTGLGSGSLTSLKEDATSKTDYGFLEDSESLSDLNDQTTLDDATQNDMDDRKVPIRVPKIVPIEEKIREVDYDVGDIVGVHIEHGFFILDDDYRVVSKRVTMNQDGQTVSVEVGLSETPMSRTDLLQEIAKLQKRVYSLEQ